MEYLIDTSAWVEFFNSRPGAALERVRALAADPDSIVMTEPVLMELRAGASGIKLAKIEGALGRFVLRGVQPERDFHVAADLYRGARQQGFTIRSMVDCLIAAVAMRTGAVLLHRDRDFDILADLAADIQCESVLL